MKGIDSQGPENFGHPEQTKSLERIGPLLEQVDAIQETDAWPGDLDAAREGYREAYGKQKGGINDFNWKIAAGFDPRLRADRKFMMAVINKGQFVQGGMISEGWGLALRYASPELKSDKGFAMEAIRNGAQSGWGIDNSEPVYKYIGPDLQKDDEVILSSARFHDGTWGFVPKEKFSDSKFLDAAVEQGLVRVLRYAPEAYRNNQELVKKMLDGYMREWDNKSDALGQFQKIANIPMHPFGDYVYEKWASIQYCSEEQRNDENFVRNALTRNADNIKYISERLAKDRTFLLDALCRGGDDYDYIQSIMSQSGHSVERDEIHTIYEKIQQEREKERTREEDVKVFDPSI